MGGRGRGRARRARPRRAGPLRGGGPGRDRPRRDRRRSAAERRPGGSFERIELSEPDVFSVAVSPADSALYAGTEPSHVFRATAPASRSRSSRPCSGSPSRENWSLPPRPWTHHVRWIAPSPHDPERLLAGIELGGVMPSTDGGQSFADHRPGAVADAHQLAWHPTAAGRAYEVGGGGAAWSIDGGESWEQDAGGLRGHLPLDARGQPSGSRSWWIAAAPGPMQAHRRGDAGAHLYRRSTAAGSGSRGRSPRCPTPSSPRTPPSSSPPAAGACGSARTAARAGSSSVPSSGRSRPSPRFPEGRRAPAARPQL